MNQLLIDKIDIRDVRFPTSRGWHGSDAMNPDPDYSCAYIELPVAGSPLVGHGLSFTIGRGNELVVAAIRSLSGLLDGITLDDCEDDLGLVSRTLVSDSQYRWLGPNKGVIHLAASALINTVWDLLAKRAGLPLWQYVASRNPGELIQAIDFTHISDFLDREEAYDKLISARSNQDGRERRLLAEGYPAYTTSAGWLGYSDKQFCDLLLEAYAAGWRHFKIKVGRDLREDQRRCALFRQTLGDDVLLSIDANQIWDVSTAVHHIDALSTYDLFWVEEPTNPDDVLAHQTIARAVPNVRIATGEHAANKVMFKQLLQASAIRICQIDACRLAGVNEVLAVLLMADKAGVPVCPHAGGIGLCEYVQHLSMIDYLCVSGSWEGRFIEHAGQLHGHFEDPISVRDGRYMAPRAPGFSVDLKPQSLAEHTFPGGTVWAQLLDGVGA